MLPIVLAGEGETSFEESPATEVFETLEFLSISLDTTYKFSRAVS